MTEQELDTEILEKLQADKMLNDYKCLLLNISPDVYSNDIELHLTAKDCCMLSIYNVLNAHTVSRDDSKKEFWVNVKEYLKEL